TSAMNSGCFKHSRQTSDHMKILHDRATPQLKGVLADSSIARPAESPHRNGERRAPRSFLMRVRWGSPWHSYPHLLVSSRRAWLMRQRHTAYRLRCTRFPHGAAVASGGQVPENGGRLQRQTYLSNAPSRRFFLFQASKPGKTAKAQKHLAKPKHSR